MRSSSARENQTYSVAVAIPIFLANSGALNPLAVAHFFSCAPDIAVFVTFPEHGSNVFVPQKLHHGTGHA